MDSGDQCWLIPPQRAPATHQPRYLRNTIGGSSILSGGALGIASISPPLAPADACSRAPDVVTRPLRERATGDDESLAGAFVLEFCCPESRRVDLET